jgi:hypothetical protein
LRLVILLERNILGFTSFGYIRIEINVRYPGLSLYRNLAIRATVGMLVATAFTSSVTVCVILYDTSAEIRSVIVTLSIIDMTLTLASIMYAMDTKLQHDDWKNNASSPSHHKRSSHCCSDSEAAAVVAALTLKLSASTTVARLQKKEHLTSPKTLV